MDAIATQVPEPEQLAVTADEPQPRASAARRLVALAAARPDVWHGTLSLFDQAVVSAGSFVTSVIIGRLGSKEELGIFYLALTIVYLARGLQEQLVSAPYVIYCHGRSQDDQARYIGSTLLHQFALTGVAMLVLFGILGLLSFGIGPAALAPTIWILLGALPFLQLREFIRRLAIAHLAMTTAATIDVAVVVLQIGGLLALAYFQVLTVALAYVVMGAACAVACAGWFVATRPALRFERDGAWSDWFHNWGFARWALASHLIGFGIPYFMPWIVTAVLGSAEAGALAACVSVVGTASMFMTGLASYLIPRASRAFASGGVPELRRVLRVATAVYAGVLGVFTVFVLATGDFLLVLAFGDKYSGYGPAMGMLALGMMTLSLGLTSGIGLWAIDRPKANLPADLCVLLVTLIAVVFLLQPLGVLGAALGDLGGKAIGAGVRYATLRRLLKTVPCATEG